MRSLLRLAGWPLAPTRRCAPLPAAGRVGSILDRPELSAWALAGFLSGKNQLNKDIAGFPMVRADRRATHTFRSPLV